MSSEHPPGLIAVPAKDWMWTESAISLHHAANAAPEGSEIKFALGWSTIAKKRNKLARYALDEGFEWVLCADADMELPEDAVARLLSVEGADLVTAACTGRRPVDAVRVAAADVKRRGTPEDDLGPCTSDPHLRLKTVPAYRMQRASGPFEVDMAGTACLLIRRRVLEALEEPWFVAREDGTGSDYNFTLRATDAGFRLLMEPSVRPGHLGASPHQLSDARDAEQTVPGRPI